MDKVLFSSNLSDYNSKALIRAKVKEQFSEFSDEIFGLVEDSGSLTSKEFESRSGVSSDFYNEYCSQLKALFEASTSAMIGKRSSKNLYITYKSENYILTQQGLTEKASVTISKFSKQMPQRETLHDVDKACLKLRFNQ